MQPWERAALYRRRASEIEQKASSARSEEMRRAWTILARDWRKMAVDVELKFLEAPESKLIPDKPAGDDAGDRSPRDTRNPRDSRDAAESLVAKLAALSTGSTDRL